MSIRLSRALPVLLFAALSQPVWAEAELAEFSEAYECKGVKLDQRSAIGSGNGPGAAGFAAGATLKTCGRGLGTAQFVPSLKRAPFGLLLGVSDRSVVLGVNKSPEKFCLAGQRAPFSIPTKTAESCTATLIGKRLIVTAEHCLREKMEYFYPGFVSNESTIVKQNEQRVAIGKVIYRSGQHADIALLELLSAPNASLKRMKIATDFLNKPIPPGRSLVFYGYPKKTSLVQVPGSQTLANQVFRNVQSKASANLFCASTDQGNGMSGGPYIFNDKILGVLHGGPLDYTNAVCGNGCEKGDACFKTMTKDYFGDSVTRADLLCDPKNVADRAIREEIGCAIGAVGK